MTVNRSYFEKLIFDDMCKVYLGKQDPNDPGRVITDIDVHIDEEEEYSNDYGGYSYTTLKVRVFSQKQNSDRSKGIWRTVEIF